MILVLFLVFAFIFLAWKSLPRFDIEYNSVQVEGTIDLVKHINDRVVLIQYTFQQGSKTIKRERRLIKSSIDQLPFEKQKIQIKFGEHFPDFIEVVEYPKLRPLWNSLIGPIVALTALLFILFGLLGFYDLEKYYYDA